MNNRNKTNRRHVHQAFTLLEILLVIGILVALAALVLPNLSGAGDKAKKGQTQVQIKTIEDALEQFKLDIGRYPTTEEGLEAMNTSDQIQDEDLVKKWQGPYLGREVKKKFELKDSWNHEFHYTCPGEQNTKSFDLSSDGPDGKEGTEDDLVNWETESD
jgi:general secretion pathway protein G